MQRALFASSSLSLTPSLAICKQCRAERAKANLLQALVRGRSGALYAVLDTIRVPGNAVYVFLVTEDERWREGAQLTKDQLRKADKAVTCFFVKLNHTESIYERIELHLEEN